MPNEASATYPGINTIYDCYIGFGNGIEPGQIALTIEPQDPATISLNGDFVLTYTPAVGSPVTITFVDCLADRATYRYALNGYITDLVIEDFRWRWRHNQISGEFNIRDDSNAVYPIGGASTVDPNDIIGYSERTPRELLGLLLDALGVASGDQDVSTVPDDIRPYVRWDYAAPSYELTALVDQLGCQIVPTPGGAVSIEVQGAGAGIPSGDIESDQIVVDPLPPPRDLVGLSGATQVQSDIRLEAVGMEVDGTIQKINDLSYKPDDGWGKWDVDNGFTTKEQDDVIQRTLAIQSVFRWYRIAVEDEDNDIDYIKQILPLSDRLLATDETTGRRYPAFCWGVFWEQFETKVSKNNYDSLDDIDREKLGFNGGSIGSDIGGSGDAIVDIPFGIDNLTGVIKFQAPIYKRNDSQMEAAELFIRTTHPRREKQNAVPERFSHNVTVDGAQSQDRYIRYDDIIHWREIIKDRTPSEETNNDTEAEDQIEQRLNLEVEKYNSAASPSTTVFVGILDAPLSGSIRHVSYTFGEDGSSTIVFKDTNPGDKVTPHQKIRDRRKVTGLLGRPDMLYAIKQAIVRQRERDE